MLAGKGVAGSRPALQLSGSKANGGRLSLVGADVIKTTIMNRLERGRLLRFSDTLQPVYFEQLTSERKVLRFVGGRPVRRFERKPGARVETLDCLLYAFAARQHLRVNFEHRKAIMAGQTPPTMPIPRSPREQAEYDRRARAALPFTVARPRRCRLGRRARASRRPSTSAAAPRQCRPSPHPPRPSPGSRALRRGHPPDR